MVTQHQPESYLGPARDVKTSQVERLVRGSIDMHVHFGPDSKIERREDVVGLVKHAAAMGMGGLVLKSKDYPTAALAHVCQPLAPEVKLFGAITLDHEVGGLNPKAVETAAQLGTKVLWFPTVSSVGDTELLGRPKEEAVYILNGHGKVKPEVDAILEVAKKHRMVVATGHLSQEETLALVKRALALRIEKLIITHPLLPNIGCKLSLEQQRELAQQGCYIEHCYVGVTPGVGLFTTQQMVQAIRAVGPDRCILSTDFGQVWNPSAPEGMWMMVAAMLKNGFSEEEVTKMVKRNPSRLLDME